MKRHAPAPKRAPIDDDPRTAPILCLKCQKREPDLGVGDPEGISFLFCDPCLKTLWTDPNLGLHVERFLHQRRR